MAIASIWTAIAGNYMNEKTGECHAIVLYWLHAVGVGDGVVVRSFVLIDLERDDHFFMHLYCSHYVWLMLSSFFQLTCNLIIS